MTATAKRAALAAAVIVALGGCGSHAKPGRPAGAKTAVSASPGVPASAVRVIRGWSDALRMGHIAAAARYFNVPSIFFDGAGPPVELRSLVQVEAVNAALPCGARFLSARAVGHYVNALFRLTNRPGPGGTEGCGSGLGLTARTNFLIRHGRIVQWLRAPDEPGDNGSPQTPQPPPTAPSPGQGSQNPAV
jgi:hypothetical protein